MNNSPKVSIGLPVFNGEEYILKCLNSIKRQNYKNIELIISVNLSTDKTKSIVKTFKKQNSWVKVFFHKKKISLTDNFLFTLKKSSSDFFMWISHDDYISNNFIKNAVLFLLKEKTCCVVQSKTQLISLPHNKRLSMIEFSKKCCI